MQLYSLLIEGYRKHLKTKIIFSDSTFLIGENNVGKSSVLYALDYLLGASSTIPLDEFYALEDGSYFIIENNTITLFGAAYLIKDGMIKQICEKDKSIII